MDEAVKWVRQCVKERLYLALHAIELGCNAEWTEQSTGVLATGEPTDTDVWFGTWAMGDSTLTRLMEANDPQDTIARCEAELGILDAYEAAAARKDAELADYAQWIDNTAPAVRPDFSGPHPRVLPGLEIAVRNIASGYKYRPGYAEHWGS